nr:Holliday junction branch migration protein RuvA [Clostridia bacterium]
MFYQVTGELILTTPNIAVIDCGGVGYQLTISSNTLGRISALKDKSKVRLFTHLKVSEDAMELFGFYDMEELNAFRLLISVSGVGAKSAVAILSLLSPEKFALAVATGDSKALSKAPGIGAKTAARIILELKDKVAKQLSAESSTSDILPTEAEDSKSNLGDAINTLLVLGYTRPEALAALKGIDTAAMELEDIIKAALKKLMRQ